MVPPEIKEAMALIRALAGRTVLRIGSALFTLFRLFEAHKLAWFSAFFLGAVAVTSINEFGLAVGLLAISAFSLGARVWVWEPQELPVWPKKIGKGIGILLTLSLFIASVAVVNQYRDDRPWSQLPAAYKNAKNVLNPSTIDTNPRPFNARMIPPPSVDHVSHKHSVAQITSTPDDVCSLPKGKTYADYSSLPGGPKLQRPMLVIDAGGANFVMQNTNENTIFMLQLVLTNRGETSIVKDWELCLIRDGKPEIYHPAQIPATGIIAGDAPPIMPDQSLVDSVIRTPIEHAHTAGGWVTFKIPDSQFIENLIKKKETMRGDIRFKDYLDHAYAFGVTFNATLVDKLPHQEAYLPGGSPKPP